jgi:hypothetical protein
MSLVWFSRTYLKDPIANTFFIQLQRILFVFMSVHTVLVVRGKSGDNVVALLHQARARGHDHSLATREGLVEEWRRAKQQGRYPEWLT